MSHESFHTNINSGELVQIKPESNDEMAKILHDQQEHIKMQERIMEQIRKQSEIKRTNDQQEHIKMQERIMEQIRKQSEIKRKNDQL